MSVRVRFAPSPTGSMHVGNARTALFNYLFARKKRDGFFSKGKFIVRIEDTDQERHKEESIISILQNLKWLGLAWDEGVFLNSKNQIIHKGSFGPYRQSERLDIYKKEAQKLIQDNKAYYCFMSEEEEQKIKDQAIQDNKAYTPSSPYRNLSLEEAQKKIEAGEKYCIRFKNKNDNKEYKINDLVRSKVTFSSDLAGDFILIRSDGYPVYNFSCAIDDALMKITHILRGEEHLPNTLRQMLVHEALGFKTPVTGHLSVILGADKKKLSKRSGAKTVEDFREEGFLSSALINFLSLLGWNPGTEQEFFTKKELIQAFSDNNFNASAAVFDEEKLLWLNKEHCKSLTNKEMWSLLEPFLKEEKIIINKKWKEIDSILEATKSNFQTLRQFASILRHFSDNFEFTISSECAEVLSWATSQSIVQEWKKFLEQYSGDYINLEDFQNMQKQLQNDLGVKGKKFFMPLRCSVLGQPQGMEIKTLVTLLEKEELIARAETLLSKF